MPLSRADGLITLRESVAGEIPLFCEMDQQHHVKDYIIATPQDIHRQYYADGNIVYLSIIAPGDALAGYFILVSEAQNSVEFRRILVSQDFIGIGQQAISQMEQYCWSELGARRIWLDVFDDNARGMHIYVKLGYSRFKSGEFEGRTLHYYEKYRNETRNH